MGYSREQRCGGKAKFDAALRQLIDSKSPALQDVACRAQAREGRPK